mgnify:CR=1 FL=1
MLQHALIQRLDAQDRAWYLRLVLAESAPALTLSFWKMLTHVGGVTASILIAFIPLGFAEDAYKIAAVQAAWTLGISHLIVQVIKRNVVRVRPTERVHLIAHVRQRRPTGRERHPHHTEAEQIRDDRRRALVLTDIRGVVGHARHYEPQSTRRIA